MKRLLFLPVLFLAATTLRAEEPATTEPVALSGGVCYKNLPYVTGGGPRQQLDLYLPEIDGKRPAADKPVPVIVWIHWGSWSHGSKDEFCLPLLFGYLGKGYAIAAVNYRLMGMAPFPAQIEDCKSAVRWLRAHAEKYGLDADRIGAWGVSAGGHLAALLGTTDRRAGFDVGEHLDKSGEVCCVCDLFGPADLQSILDDPNFEELYRTHEAEVKRFLGGDPKEKLDLAFKASPTTHVSKNSAPFLILHGDEDKIVPVAQSQRLHEKLKEAGVAGELVVIRGGGHGTGGFLTLDVLQKIENFFEKHLQSKKTRDD